MLRVLPLGPSNEDTRILSTVCAACPHAAAGCCVAPPPMDWSDVGRIVARGGSAWLVAEIAAKRLVPRDGGLTVTRRKGVARPDGPRVAKCVYHGVDGCTVSPERRAATCNYYVCESALAEDAREAPRAREVHAELVATYRAWDEELARRVAHAFPDGPPWDDAFLTWLGSAFDALRVRG